MSVRAGRRSLWLLHPEDDFARRVERATVGEFWVRRVVGWEGAHAAAEHASRRDLLVVDPYHGSPYGLHPSCTDLLHRFPSAIVLGVLRPRSGYLRDVAALGAAGMREVIDVGELASQGAVRRRLAETSGRLTITDLAGPLLDRIPPRGRVILDIASAVSAEHLGVSEVARRLYLSPRTLLRWTHQSGLPVPRELLQWIRLLSAAELLDDPGRTVHGAALAAGYADEDSLGTALSRRLGVRARVLQSRGAFRTATESFRRALEGSLQKAGAPDG